MTTSNNDKKIIKPLTSDPHQEIMITSSKIVATTKNAKEDYQGSSFKWDTRSIYKKKYFIGTDMVLIDEEVREKTSYKDASSNKFDEGYELDSESPTTLTSIT